MKTLLQGVDGLGAHVLAQTLQLRRWNPYVGRGQFGGIGLPLLLAPGLEDPRQLGQQSGFDLLEIKDMYVRNKLKIRAA